MIGSACNVVSLQAEPLDASALVDRIRRPDCGGLVVFEGMPRSPSNGNDVLWLEYEAWEERALRQMREICEDVARRCMLGGALAVHRVGGVPVGETSVLVAACAPHREEAFAGARELIDRVKDEAAIWKKEIPAERTDLVLP